MSKRYICKSKFHVCFQFLDMKIPGEKTFCPKHPKKINWNKKWHKFLFSRFFVVSQGSVMTEKTLDEFMGKSSASRKKPLQNSSAP